MLSKMRALSNLIHIIFPTFHASSISGNERAGR
jgi:hypothetical protein